MTLGPSFRLPDNCVFQSTIHALARSRSAIRKPVSIIGSRAHFAYTPMVACGVIVRRLSLGVAKTYPLLSVQTTFSFLEAASCACYRLDRDADTSVLGC